MAQAIVPAAVAHACRTHLDAYAAWVHNFRPAWHHRVWLDRIQAVVEGRTAKRKLLILAPPGMGKSVYVGTVLPAWYLGNHPDQYLMHFTSSDDNAFSQLGTIKLCLDGNERHQVVFPDDRCRPNKDRGWSQLGLYLNATPESERHPGYRALGMTTTFTGARAHGVIIDDPASQADARSEAKQKEIKRTYAEEIVPRLVPDGWVIAISTRWHEKDLPGFWIEMMKEGREDWEVLALPGIAESGVDYGGPTPGVFPHGDRALWPERRSYEWLLAERARLTIPVFNCQYQHDPTSIGGDVFRDPAWFQPLPSDFNVPGRSGRRFRDTLTVVQFWDLAFSSKTSADWTVAVTLGKDVDGRLYVLNVWRARVAELVDKTLDDERGLAAHVADHIAQTQPAVVAVENNAFQNGVTKSLINRVSKLLIKKGVACAVKGQRVDTDKVTRAQLPATLAQNGSIFVDTAAHWWPDALKEIMGFPNAANDDVVDALAGACRLAIEGVVGASGEQPKPGTYSHKAAEDPRTAASWSPFQALDDQYAALDRERIERVLARTRDRRYADPAVEQHSVPN